jgi:YT521-B-like domain
VWRVRRQNAPGLSAALAGGAPVVLVFTVAASQQFQGYAVMLGDVEVSTVFSVPLPVPLPVPPKCVFEAVL